jgi:hypothetical protein
LTDRGGKASVRPKRYPMGILIYIKLVEERELEQRFGLEYLEYK